MSVEALATWNLALPQSITSESGRQDNHPFKVAAFPASAVAYAPLPSCSESESESFCAFASILTFTRLLIERENYTSM